MTTMTETEAPKPKKKYKKLSPRHKKFIETFIKEDNITEAYTQAYPNIKDRKTAGAAGSALLKTLSNREEVLKHAGLNTEEMGILARKAIKKTAEKLRAKTTKVATYEGKITDTLELPDHEVQLKAANQLLEVTGAFPSRFREQEGDGPLQINIQVIVPWGGRPQDTQSSGQPAESKEA